MPIRAGDLRDVIALERSNLVKDDYGGAGAATWSELAQVRARVSYGTGVERRAAAQEQAVQSVTFLVRASLVTRSLTPVDRIRFEPGGLLSADSPAWDIQSVVPRDRDGIEITATRSS
jgi:head-tail adaptor